MEPESLLPCSQQHVFVYLFQNQVVLQLNLSKLTTWKAPLQTNVLDQCRKICSNCLLLP
jgi:hypothetical protein